MVLDELRTTFPPGAEIVLGPVGVTCRVPETLTKSAIFYSFRVFISLMNSQLDR